MADSQELRKQIEDIKRKIEDISTANASDGFFEELTGVNGQRALKKRRNLSLFYFGKIYAMHWAGEIDGDEQSSHQLVSASQDGKLIIWDGMTTNKKNAIPLRSSWVMTCAFERKKNKLVACGGLDNLCSIFKTGTDTGNSGGRVHQELQGHDGYLSCCRFWDEDSIITSSGDSTCFLWDLTTGQCKASFSDHGGDVMSVALSPEDNNIFVSGSCDTTAKVWDKRQTTATSTFKGHESDINTVSIFPDGYALGTGSDDSCCKLFDRRACMELNQYHLESILCGITSVDFSSSGRILFAGYDDYSCHAWDTLAPENSDPQKKVEKYSNHENRVSCLGVDQRGQALCTGSWDTVLNIYG